MRPRSRAKPVMLRKIGTRVRARFRKFKVVQIELCCGDHSMTKYLISNPPTRTTPRPHAIRPLVPRKFITLPILTPLFEIEKWSDCGRRSALGCSRMGDPFNHRPRRNSPGEDRWRHRPEKAASQSLQ